MAISKGSADFYLTIDGVQYPFWLAKDENGAKTWGDGYAPIITPQFRTDEFGYEHVPPEFEVIESFEGWGHGAGFKHVHKDDNKTQYNYSRGLDLSFEDRVLLALKQTTILESDGTAIAASAVKFYYSSLGLFMLAGAYIYEWDLSTTTWVQRDDASADATSYKDIIELDGKLYASRGPSLDYKYSSDGITWTAFTAEDENADFFTLRGNGSDVAAIWKFKTNVIKVSTDGTIAGWTGSDELGGTSETVRGMLTVNNDIYVFKAEGFYLYDGSASQDLWRTQYITSYNGKNPLLSKNGRVYVPYGSRLLEFDPYNADSIALRAVFPTPGMDSLELRGDITATADGIDHIYVAMKNLAGNTYILKGQETPHGWAWHTVLYLGANDCDALLVVGPGVMHAANPALVWGHGSAVVKYTVLPRVGLSPDQDRNCSFDTSEGVLYGPYVDFGAKSFPKFLNRGSVLGENISASRYATLKYEKDDSGTETTLVSATGGRLTEANEAAEVSLHQVRPVLYAATSDYSSTPVVDGLALFATLNPRRKRVWRPVINITDGALHRGGSDTETLPSAEELRRRLFAAVTKRLTMTREGLDYIVRLHDIQPATMSEKDRGGAEGSSTMYQLTLLEIQGAASDATVGVYGESAYGRGHVYA